jgi:ActR/RegA family two-component response regulator
MSAFRDEPTAQRLLLVEEDRHAIDDLRDEFSTEGYECEVALDIETARSILQGRLMDVAVINLSLVAASDEGLVEELKAYNQEMRIVLYNGTAEKAEQRKLRRMGADSYLSEASDLSAVARAAQRLLARSVSSD